MCTSLADMSEASKWIAETSMLISDMEYQLVRKEEILGQLCAEIKRLQVAIKTGWEIVEAYKSKHFGDKE